MRLNLLEFTIDPRIAKLTDFMKAIGQEHPVSADGNLRIFKAPYDKEHKPTLVVNVETNLWRDTITGAHGGIYELVYELVGSWKNPELTIYFACEVDEQDITF